MEFAQKKILENIESIREYKRKMTRKALVEKINISEATYSRIVDGKVLLTYNRLADIAKALDYSVINIITYPDEYINQQNPTSTKVLVELEVSNDEFIKLGLKDKVLQILNK
ncbi:helix-turn-helix domain-containing protein [Dysgonomonas termitidis]|uniref:Helix-turn-helix domain-containing protein n=1 Tax=Dysgonomonas termitidis TaxID=1516126 RepID=A0ABV9KV77_9BACT